MSGDDKPTKPAKEEVKDELTSTDEDKMALTEEMLQLKNNKEYLGRLKNNHTYVFYSDITLVLIAAAPTISTFSYRLTVITIRWRKYN